MIQNVQFCKITLSLVSWTAVKWIPRDFTDDTLIMIKAMAWWHQTLVDWILRRHMTSQRANALNGFSPSIMCYFPDNQEKDLWISETPFAAHCDGQRTNHSAMGHSSKQTGTCWPVSHSGHYSGPTPAERYTTQFYGYLLVASNVMAYVCLFRSNMYFFLRDIYM